MTTAGGPSVACSTAKAIEWDASFADAARQASISAHLISSSSCTPGHVRLVSWLCAREYVVVVVAHRTSRAVS